MSARTLALVDAAGQAAEAIRCPNPECGQVIGYRMPDGPQPIKPARCWTEKNGRRRIECPVCKARKTVEEAK